MKTAYTLLFIAALLTTFAFVPPAYASKSSVVCGQLITKNTRLHSNLSCTLLGWNEPGSVPALAFGVSGVTLDCSHHSITLIGIIGSGGVVGIGFNGASNAKVKNCIVTGFNIGIKDSGSNDTIIGNSVNDASMWGFADFSPPGSGTAGTSNTYIGNTCHNDATPSTPDGLCRVV